MRSVKQYIKMGSNAYKVMNRWDSGKLYHVAASEAVLVEVIFTTFFFLSWSWIPSISLKSWMQQHAPVSPELEENKKTVVMDFSLLQTCA